METEFLIMGLIAASLTVLVVLVTRLLSLAPQKKLGNLTRWEYNCLEPRHFRHLLTGADIWGDRIPPMRRIDNDYTVWYESGDYTWEELVLLDLADRYNIGEHVEYQITANGLRVLTNKYNIKFY